MGQDEMMADGGSREKHGKKHRKRKAIEAIEGATIRKADDKRRTRGTLGVSTGKQTHVHDKGWKARRQKLLVAVVSIVGVRLFVDVVVLVEWYVLVDSTIDADTFVAGILKR